MVGVVILSTEDDSGHDLYAATSALRCKTVNDSLGTQLVDNLIRLVVRQKPKPA
jgi:hypothetical protein